MIPQSPSPPFYTSDDEGRTPEEGEGEGGPALSKFQFELTLDDQDEHRENRMMETGERDHLSNPDMVERTSRDASPAET